MSQRIPELRAAIARLEVERDRNGPRSRRGG